MSITTGPFSLPAKGQLRITLPPATLVVKAVVLGNLGSAAAEVSIAGSSRVLLPGSADLFPVSTGSGQIVVTSLGTGASTITATWLTPDEIPAAGFPYGAPVTNLNIEPGAVVQITGPVTISGLVTSIGQLTSTTIPMQAVVSQTPVGFFGSGTTGTLTLRVPATLTRTMYYKNLTLSTAAFYPAGHRVFVSDIMSATVACVVSNNGLAGGSAFTFTTAAADGGLGGAAGRFMAGGTGGTATSASHTTQSVTAGAGAGNANYTGGNGGAGLAKGTTKALMALGGGVGIKYAGVPTVTSLVDKTLAGGAGGGAAAGNTLFNSYYHVTLAGGGGGGGVLFVAARVIEDAITLQANGGAGGYTITLSAASGGGGGGGIVAFFAHKSSTWAGSVHITPGAQTIPPTPPPPPSGGRTAAPGTPIVLKTVEGKLRV